MHRRRRGGAGAAAARGRRRHRSRNGTATAAKTSEFSSAVRKTSSPTSSRTLSRPTKRGARIRSYSVNASGEGDERGHDDQRAQAERIRRQHERQLTVLSHVHPRRPPVVASKTWRSARRTETCTRAPLGGAAAASTRAMRRSPPLDRWTIASLPISSIEDHLRGDALRAEPDVLGSNADVRRGRQPRRRAASRSPSRFMPGEPTKRATNAFAGSRQISRGVATCCELAVPEHRDPVAQRQRLGLVVRDVEHRRADPLVQQLQLGSRLAPAAPHRGWRAARRAGTRPARGRAPEPGRRVGARRRRAGGGRRSSRRAQPDEAGGGRDSLAHDSALGTSRTSSPKPMFSATVRCGKSA